MPLPEGGREQLPKEQVPAHTQLRVGSFLLSLPLQDGAEAPVLWDRGGEVVEQGRVGASSEWWEKTGQLAGTCHPEPAWLTCG